MIQEATKPRLVTQEGDDLIRPEKLDDLSEKGEGDNFIKDLLNPELTLNTDKEWDRALAHLNNITSISQTLPLMLMERMSKANIRHVETAIKSTLKELQEKLTMSLEYVRGQLLSQLIMEREGESDE